MTRRCDKVSMRPSALASALLLALGAPAWAAVVVDGSWSIDGNVPVGPGDSLLPTKGLYVGNGSPGTLRVDDGNLLQVASMVFGSGQVGTGNGLLTGTGSRIELTGNGFDQGSLNRFEVGGWGTSLFTVADGALLDGRANSAACVGVNHYCNNFIGNAAGSTGTFVVTGSGSTAQFLRAFVVGGVSVFHPPIDSFTFGTPAGTTRGAVNVLAGGKLVTDFVTLGRAPSGGSPTGNERSFADVTVDGAGSLWRVTGGTLEPSQYANVSTATHRNAWATLAITGGGEMRLEGNGDKYTVVNLSSGGGRTDMLVSGADSRLHFAGQSGVFNIGTATLSTAAVELRNGGRADGMFYTGVGRNGALASLLVDGAGTLMRIDNTATAAANGVSGAAYFEIGRNGGNGTVTVSNGGRIEVLATVGTTNGTGMGIGRDANSAGTLNIDSGGVVLFRSTSSAPGTAAETSNPSVLVGREGSGSLNISGGGKLLLEGGGVSTPAARRSTNLYIGGRSDSDVGGHAIATVTGAGSAIRLTGQDSFIGVGIGPQSSGQLTVASGGQISANGMSVGRSGGVGVLKLNGGQLTFSGQQTAGNLSGAFLVFGSGGGIGTGLFENGSTVTLSNPGSSGAGLSLGGTGGAFPYPGGDGSLTLSGGSSLVVTAAPGLAYTNVGREGSGLLRLRGGSSLALGDGVMQVARNSGSDGTVIAAENSTITAGWVGVGARKADTGNVDGGTGTFVLINSTLTAAEIVIGTNGFLGGTGTITGKVTLRGIFAPGNSPGTLHIGGDFSAAAGSRMILEVQSDGSGGFNTDTVVFSNGHALDLSALKVEFRFLGNTDPNAFQTSGRFGVDSFFQSDDGNGHLTGLGSATFASAQFSAQSDAYRISNFSFDAASGASFSATPVPEPTTTALLLAGLATLGWLARRRRG